MTMMMMMMIVVVVVTIYLLSCEIVLERNSCNVCVQDPLETSFDQSLKLLVPSFFSYFSDSVYTVLCVNQYSTKIHKTSHRN